MIVRVDLINQQWFEREVDRFFITDGGALALERGLVAVACYAAGTWLSCVDVKEVKNAS